MTIITVVYNNAKAIEQAISSVVNQTYRNIEYIIIDGASTDGTVDIIKKYASLYTNIRWISEPDDGIFYAINKAIDMATGDYIQVIGSDDCLICENIIERVIQNLWENQDIDILCAGRTLVSEKTHLETYQCSNVKALKGNKNSVFWTPHTGIFVRTSIYKKEKFNTKYRLGADYYFILKSYYIDKYKFGYLDYSVAYFSDSGVSGNNDKCQMETQKILKDLNIDVNINVPNQENTIKNGIKMILKNLNLLDVALVTLNKRQKHTCSNKICYWCGRKG